MKVLITFFLSLYLVVQVNASCTSSGIWVFPESKMIKQNSVLLVEGYLLSQQIIHELNTEYPVYLQTKGHKVRLKIQETHVGMFRLSQALLVPEEALIAGKTYVLKIENIEEFLSRNENLLMRRNIETGEREPFSWTVSDSTYLIPPSISQPPILINTEYESYGCGPEVFANFKIEIDDASDCLVKTELFDLDTKKSNVYLLKRGRNGNVCIGHGMCSGAFEFEKDHRYQVRFSPMDLSGQTTKKWTEWIAFDSPKDKLSY